MTSRLRLVALVLALVLAASACGSEQTALEVGDLTITRSELLDALDEQGLVVDGVAPSSAAADYLTDRARNALLQGAADRAGLDVTVDATTGDEIFTTLVANEVEARVPGIREVAGSNLTCSRHILVDTEAQASDLLAQLNDDGDFAALAQEFSLDPGSGAVGGDLGCQPLGTFVPEFDAALLEAAVNEVVGPVETQFGFHLIEKLPSPEADAASVVEAGLTTAFAAQEEFDEWRNDLLGGDDVVVDARYGEWDPALLAVVPTGPSTTE